MANLLIQLPIEECQAWIPYLMSLNNSSGIKYSISENREYLLFRTDGPFAQIDAEILKKIKTITGMSLIQIFTNKEEECFYLMFGRPIE